MRRGYIAYALEMGHEINRQPGAIATEDHHSVDARGEKARINLYTRVVDHRRVCRDPFRRLDAVNAGGDLETVERDIGCHSINGDAVGGGSWSDLVEGREKVLIWQVREESQSSKVGAYRTRLSLALPLENARFVLSKPPYHPIASSVAFQERNPTISNQLSRLLLTVARSPLVKGETRE